MQQQMTTSRSTSDASPVAATGAIAAERGRPPRRVLLPMIGFVAFVRCPSCYAPHQ